MKITPVLIVEQIEPSLEFWVDRMGFETTVEVPEEDRLGFVILVRNGVELMLQAEASVRKDQPEFAPEEKGSRASLFIEVDDFPDTVKRLAGYPIAMPERDTFTGCAKSASLNRGATSLSSPLANFSQRESATQS